MFVLRCLYKSAYFIFTFWVKKISNFIPCISNNDFSGYFILLGLCFSSLRMLYGTWYHSDT